MARYVAISPVTPDQERDKGPFLPLPSVDGARQVDTGLVDRFGKTIVRIQPPIGFGRDDEW